MRLMDGQKKEKSTGRWMINTSGGKFEKACTGCQETSHKPSLKNFFLRHIIGNIQLA